MLFVVRFSLFLVVRCKGVSVVPAWFVRTFRVSIFGPQMTDDQTRPDESQKSGKNLIDSPLILHHSLLTGKTSHDKQLHFAPDEQLLSPLLTVSHSYGCSINTAGRINNTMSLRYEKSEFLSFASCQIAANSNEDRVAAVLNHRQSGAEKFSSFGVFDGHKGVRTHKLCTLLFYT